MHIEWNNVTWYSQLLAIGLGLVIFALGFYLGQVWEREGLLVVVEDRDRNAELSVATTTEIIDPDLEAETIREPNQKTNISPFVEGYRIEGHQVATMEYADDLGIVFTNDSGELLVRLETGEITKLISSSTDFVQTDQRINGGDRMGEAFVKGRVGSFWLSPSEEWIIYEQQNNIGGCCESQIPVHELWRMRPSGTDREVLLPYTGQRISFETWIPRTNTFVYNISAHDDATMGGPWQVMDVGTRESTKLIGVEYYAFSPDYVVTAIAEPVFSPLGDRFAYCKGGIVSDEGLWLTEISTQTTRQIYDTCGELGKLTWLADGALLQLSSKSSPEKLFTDNGEQITSEIEEMLMVW